ncbi:MAG: protein phosphatase 2C domain-containing protein [Desulfobacterales bacterium]
MKIVRGHAVNNSLNGELSCVADGMGGHGYGELRSQAAVDATLNGFIGANNSLGRKSHKILTDLFTAAETAIHDEKRKNSITATMGTTLAVLIILPEAALCANIGDSRIYCLRERDLTQKSHGHTMVNELLEKNQITIEEAKAHPQKNVLTRALIMKLLLATLVQVEPAAAGTIYLLCSDGFYNMVDEDYMAEILRTSSIFQARDSFLTQAYANGATTI